MARQRCCTNLNPGSRSSLPCGPASCDGRADSKGGIPGIAAQNDLGYRLAG